MFKDKDILISLTILLVTILVASSYYLISNFLKEKKQNDMFKDLEQVVTTDDIQNNVLDETNDIDQNQEENLQTTTYSSIDLNSLKIQNSDLVGWIKVDGTNINYPVMQNGEYYLKRNFYKEYSQLGTPFLASHCNIKTNDNLIIYGHHIKSGLMFADLDKYKSYSFYKNHKYIYFYTLDNGVTKKNIYEICFAFTTTANNGGFKYYAYNNFFDKNDFNDFVDKCQNIELYNTGVSANYGDNFITLSTCEYSQDNGRMVVVGKLISQM